MDLGVIFDWDGVVLDSYSLHKECWESVAAEEHFPSPGDLFDKSFGLKNEAIIADLFKWTTDRKEIERISHKRDLRFIETVEKQGIFSFPGVLDFLRELRSAAVPCAVGSSTKKINASPPFRGLSDALLNLNICSML